MSNLRKSRYQRRSAPLPITEKAFQAQVIELLKLHGWRVYHTFDSRRSEPGFPDLIAIRGYRLLAIEVKTESGKVTEEQAEWLQAFARVERVEAMIVRPADNLDALEWLASSDYGAAHL